MLEEELQVELIPLNRYNWERALELEIEQDQQKFMPSVLHSLAQSRFENCTPFGIYSSRELCGFLMYCMFQQVAWINRILVDRRYQGKGIGSKGLALALKSLKTKPDCKEIRASVSTENLAGIRLFTGAGFQPIADGDGGEIVLRWKG